MSASSQIAVLLENEVLVASSESDAIQVEGSEYSPFIHRYFIPSMSWLISRLYVDFYFPEQDLKHRERYEESDTHTTCGWKG